MPVGIYKRIIGVNCGLPNQGFQKGHKGSTYWLGKKMSVEHRKKFSKRMMGHIPWNKNIKNCFSEETIKTMREKMKGKYDKEKHPQWIQDRTTLQKYGETNKDRRSSMYRDWRLSVYKRDNYKCKINNSDCVGRIIAHHILSYTKFENLRYDINNGITFCQFHHPRKRDDENKLSPYFQEIIKNELF